MDFVRVWGCARPRFEAVWEQGLGLGLGFRDWVCFIVCLGLDFAAARLFDTERAFRSGMGGGGGEGAA